MTDLKTHAKVRGHVACSARALEGTGQPPRRAPVLSHALCALPRQQLHREPCRPRSAAPGWPPALPDAATTPLTQPPLRRRRGAPCSPILRPLLSAPVMQLLQQFLDKSDGRDKLLAAVQVRR